MTLPYPNDWLDAEVVIGAAEAVITKGDERLVLPFHIKRNKRAWRLGAITRSGARHERLVGGAWQEIGWLDVIAWSVWCQALDEQFPPAAD